MAPIHKRQDGTVINLKVPSGVPVRWRIHSLRTGDVLVDNVEARTPFEAWKAAALPQPFSEVECVEVP